MRDTHKTNIFIAILLACAISGVVFFQNRIAIRRFAYTVPDQLIYLPPKEYAQALSMDYSGLWSDIIWIRMLQYFGGHFMTDKEFKNVDRMFDVLFALDPYFKDGYSFCGLVMGEEMGQVDAAVSFMDIGIENIPNDFRIAFDAGFMLMQSSKDYDRAKIYFEKALEKENCPDYVKRIIPHMESEAGRYKGALKYYVIGLKEAREKNDTIAANIYERKIKETQKKIDLKILNDAVAIYFRRYDQFPDDIQQLVSRRVLRGIPADPYGGKYHIQATGTVESSFETRENTEKFLSQIRSRIFKYYKDNGAFPPTLLDVFDGPASQDLYGGKWVYNPVTGSIYTSARPEM